MKRKHKIILPILILIILIFGFMDGIVNFIINIKWFKEVGYLSVYFKKITATLKLMVPIFLVCFIGIIVYYRSLRKGFIKNKNISQTDKKATKKENIIFYSLNIILSFLISYITASNYWYRIVQFNNSVDFNVKDPLFNKDVSFYMFKLPLIQSLFNAMMAFLIVLLIVTFVVYIIMRTKDGVYTKNFKRPFSKVKFIKSDITNYAGKQLAVLSSMFLIMIGIFYILKSYYLVYSSKGVGFGASFTDARVSLYFYRAISGIAIVSSIVIFVSIIKGKIKPIVISLIAMAVVIILEGLTSTLVQQFMVKSNELEFERPYIKQNIDFTRKAFNIDDIKESIFDVKDDLTKEDIDKNKDIIDNIKVNSFNPALDFYNQVQIIRYYYNFKDIDVDRYNIDDKYSQVFIAPREIDSDSIEPNTWLNKHLVYTHGYGVVMSRVNSVTAEGKPNFVIKNIPPENNSNIKIDNPRIYFGESTDYYAVVNTEQREFDYPKGGENETNKYDGNAGINMSFINRILFSIKEKSIKFMLSNDINVNSKILINRNIMERAKTIAPFLTYDKDPYIVIQDGKLYWILDAYTTSNKYPFSEPHDDINYIRNSVKVVIDSFNGDINFYISDKNDPIIQSYSKIFKGLFKDIDDLPTEFIEHFRYPEEIFNIQCSALGKYHIKDPEVFYNGEDLWEISKNKKETKDQSDNKAEEEKTTEASYIVTKLPNEEKEEMVLFEYFNMRSKENMVALFGARMDGDQYGKLVLYKFPPTKTIYSPYLFKNQINQDPNISKELSLWNTEGSKVYYGDTVIVPIKNSLLYIEPLYLKAISNNSIPEMKKVVVYYGDKMVMAENIEKALEQIFNYKESDKIDDKNTTTDVEIIKEVRDLYYKAVDSQKEGDWAKYGEYMKELEKILNETSK
ncbi:UPF0182 family protein [Clostridium algidicarnis]|uniref:UPF0182 family protein n=1 Tax=Clostridium algidicarnis TaxID=37659 RepID=UPI001C0B3803|nr:UPF0182 family protein [Clostridium algidicarnis]MBU3194703.1 UPF0182 family protein [Clostridium algidicarnis]